MDIAFEPCHRIPDHVQPYAAARYARDARGTQTTFEDQVDRFVQTERAGLALRNRSFPDGRAADCSQVQAASVITASKADAPADALHLDDHLSGLRLSCGAPLFRAF